MRILKRTILKLETRSCHLSRHVWVDFSVGQATKGVGEGSWESHLLVVRTLGRVGAYKAQGQGNEKTAAHQEQPEHGREYDEVLLPGDKFPLLVGQSEK